VDAESLEAYRHTLRDQYADEIPPAALATWVDRELAAQRERYGSHLVGAWQQDIADWCQFLDSGIAPRANLTGRRAVTRCTG
jgi:hypothetical protein